MMKTTRPRQPGLQKLMAPRNWSAPFTVLSLFLVLIFLTGGTSRYDTPHLMLLRPAAVITLGYACLSLTQAHLRSYWPLWVLFSSCVLLVISHLIPLPPSLWQNLPGRELVSDIDAFAGLEGAWRPLTLFPEGTWNALFALLVPLAVLGLASQLEEEERLRLLILVILLVLVSGFIGVIQATGADIRSYRISSNNAGLFANRNHQATILATLFPMLAAAALCAPSLMSDARPIRLVVAAGMAALVPLVLVTGSRMGMVVSAMAFLSLIFMRFRRNKGGRAFAFSGLVQVFAAIALMGGMVAATMFMGRDESIDRMLSSSDGMRWPVWQSMAEFIPEYWPVGSGVSSFVPIYQIHEPNALLLSGYFNQAHNDWLDIALTSGLPGLLIAAAAIGLYGFSVKSALKTRGISGHLQRCGLIMILVLAFASISDYPVRTPILSALLTIAAVWSSGSITRDEKEV